MDQKRCSTCKEMKAIEEFGLDRSAKDGHQRRCRLCDRSYQKQWSTKNALQATNRTSTGLSHEGPVL